MFVDKSPILAAEGEHRSMWLIFSLQAPAGWRNRNPEQGLLADLL